jgi:hypothetical protein
MQHLGHFLTRPNTISFSWPEPGWLKRLTLTPLNTLGALSFLRR